MPLRAGCGLVPFGATRLLPAQALEDLVQGRGLLLVRERVDDNDQRAVDIHDVELRRETQGQRAAGWDGPRVDRPRDALLEPGLVALTTNARPLRSPIVALISGLTVALDIPCSACRRLRARWSAVVPALVVTPSLALQASRYTPADGIAISSGFDIGAPARWRSPGSASACHRSGSGTVSSRPTWWCASSQTEYGVPGIRNPPGSGVGAENADVAAGDGSSTGRSIGGSRDASVNRIRASAAP